VWVEEGRKERWEEVHRAAASNGEDYALEDGEVEDGRKYGVNCVCCRALTIRKRAHDTTVY
jgi:hypothetical protein